jgi:hypothetical protein
VLETLALVLADVVLLLVLLQMIHAVAADVADGNARLFGILANKLCEFLAPFFRELRNGQADQLPVGYRVEPESGGSDRFLDRSDIRPVPHLDGKHPRLRHRNRRDLVEGHVRPVDFDMDGIEQRGRRAPGPKPGKIMFQRLDGAMHPTPEVVGADGGGHVWSPFCTIVAVPFPASTRARLPD